MALLNNNFSKLLLLLFLVLLVTVKKASSQYLGASKEEIKSILGKNYEYGKTAKDIPYFIYKKVSSSNILGKYESNIVVYFNKNNICFRQKLICPKEVTNEWVEYLNDRFVNLDEELKWKDYKTDVIYKMNISDNMIITLFLDDDRVKGYY